MLDVSVETLWLEDQLTIKERREPILKSGIKALRIIKGWTQSPDRRGYPRHEKEEEVYMHGQWFMSMVEGRGMLPGWYLWCFQVNTLERQGLRGRGVWAREWVIGWKEQRYMSWLNRLRTLKTGMKLIIQSPSIQSTLKVGVGASSIYFPHPYHHL